MKRKLKLKIWVKVVLCFILVVVSICIVFSIVNTHNKTKNIEIKEKVKKEKNSVKKDLNSVSESVQEKSEEPEEQYVEPVVEVSNEYTTRMTSFYPAESSDCTGSGLCSWDFGINENGWYTYNGKLVVATATQYLANQGWYLADGVHTYRYYEEITLVIDGVEYQAIVLDSCGSSMRTDRIDLFVRDAGSVKDTMINVRSNL